MGNKPWELNTTQYESWNHKGYIQNEYIHKTIVRTQVCVHSRSRRWGHLDVYGAEFEIRAGRVVLWTPIAGRIGLQRGC